VNDRSTIADEAITAAQRRHRFEELIGATRDKDTRLWRALDQVIVAALDERDERMHEEVAALCRHFPSLEHAMLAVWHHVTRIDGVGSCGLCELTA